MNTTIARQIAEQIAQLAVLTARFQANYGRNVLLTDLSPEGAHALAGQILDGQASIAALLDPRALETTYHRFGQWWKRHDVIDCAIINELAIDAHNLIARTAYLEAEGGDEATLLPIQKSIAGMLHPAARQRVPDRINPLLEAV